MRQTFRRRLGAIAVGSICSGMVGAVVAACQLPAPTRILGGGLLVGTVAACGFWTARLWSFPAIGRRCGVWLVGCYVVGLCSLVLGLGAAVWAALVGVGGALHWLCVLLLVAEVGEHFGVRWVDGQNRWFPSRWLGGAAWVGLYRRAGRCSEPGRGADSP
ncbi:MAG: hypothetical protein RMJ56_12180 [Gemmataceae bacterium]|nr:hypothetical protein [Gemmata sp.]MDW8198350.1 hypothetical protein [Gemmataceae bacterium]